MIGKPCLLPFFLLILGAGSTSAAADDVKAVEDTLRAYEQAWSHLDAHAAASFYYEPTIRVTSGGPVVRAKRADQEAFFGTFLPALAKSGYTRSAFEGLQVRLLDPNTAIASGVTVRYRGPKRV